MKKNSLIVGALVAVVTTITGCAHTDLQTAARDAQMKKDGIAVTTNEQIDPRVADRVAQLIKKMPAKLSKQTKLARADQVAQWQQSWGSRDAQTPFDQPQGALTHFLSKRLAEGQSTTLGPADYLDALQQAAAMPVYSTFEGRFVSDANPQTPLSTSQSIASTVSPGLGGTWTAMGPGNIGGRTRAILIHPITPATMWASGTAGGIWKTNDGGTTWTPKADLLVNIAVNSMMLDPRNPDILYAGTGEGFFNGDAVRGAGILKSLDGGETWVQLASTATPDFFYVQKIVMSRGSSQRIYAATRTGVFRSVDGGGTWTKVLDGTTVNGCMDLAIQTDRALAMVFASCGTFTQGAIYRALDTSSASQSWTSVFSPPNMGRTTLALAPSNQNILYAMAASIETGNFTHGLLGVFRSTASGASGSWTTRVSNTSPVKLNTLLLSNPVYGALGECGFGASQFINQGWYDNIIAVDPVDPNIVWAGGIDLFRSNDGGQNFGQASHWWFGRGVDPEYAHADNHAIAFHPQYNGTTNKIMFNGSDGGIFVTNDARAPVAFSPNPITPASPVCGNTVAGGLAWGEKNNGYQVTQFYHGATYPDGDTFIAGAQDNGTIRGATGLPNAWQAIQGGDGGYVAVNPLNTNMLWAEFTGLSLRRSVNGGTSFSTFTNGITEAGGNFLFIAPFAQDPSNPSNMWIGGASPWRNTNATGAGSPAWVRAGAFFGSRIGAWAVAPQSSDRVYAGTGTGNAALNCRVFTTGIATTSTSATVWSSSKVRPDGCFVSWVAADPVTLGTVYATVSTFNTGTGVGHVFKSTNFGATWTSIDGSGATGIPDVPVHTIVADPNDNQRLYIGTDIGVFISLDGGANWARENTGFANVIVEALTIKNTVPRYIYAFTHGRSLFRALLP